MDKSQNIYNEIPGSSAWDSIQKINKGWSNDSKYYIKTIEGKELLLRVSGIEKFENKKQEFEVMKQLETIHDLISRTIDFGISNNRQFVYSLLSWIDGEDAEIILPKLKDKEQYVLGIKAGEILSKIHSIPAPQKQKSWSERFNNKINRNIKNFKTCKVQLQGADKIIGYIEKNRHLLENRPQSLQHGDYHIGNMIVTKPLELGIIDFSRFDYGDPWEEFNRINFCVDISPLFASGLINGYFNDNVPDLFFRLMALYIGSNQLSAIPWAISFGEEEVNNMLRHAENIIKWYDGFENHIPNWYVAAL